MSDIESQMGSPALARAFGRMGEHRTEPCVILTQVKGGFIITEYSRGFGNSENGRSVVGNIDQLCKEVDIFFSSMSNEDK